jgi:metallo-beta-lactamase family protein
MPLGVLVPWLPRPLRHYEARAAELDPELQGSAAPDPGRLRARKDVSAFATARFQVVASTQQSKELTASRRPGVVISSSGMATGGRVLHHLAAALPDRRNTVLFVGYRAAGTRGRSLVDGAPAVKIHGRQITVAAEVARIDSMSAHADRGEIVRWLRTLPEPPGRLFLVHGEPPPMDALKDLIARECGWRPETPELGDIVTC